MGWIAAAVLFAFAVLYRFNALGGGFGGFDNDHFLHFAHAKQVQAGEQPLRDFLDAGLQGARPSLTYELSAAAQTLFGDSLLPEAWLTVSALALGAAVTFLAARAIAPTGWAFLTVLLSVLIAPKLYNYPKVLALAVASALIVTYAARPSRGKLVAMAVTTAVAFLFRHDYAVYCGIGFGVVILMAHRRDWAQGVRRALAVAGLALVLVAPSLLWVERHAGLIPYLLNAADMSAAERERTRLPWPTFEAADGWLTADLFTSETNAEAWLYYLFLAIPILVMAGAAAAWRRGQERDALAAPLALGLMTLILWYVFLRGNVGARFGDMVPPVAVLGALLLGQAMRRVAGSGRRAVYGRMLAAAVALTVAAVTTATVWSLGSVTSELRTGGFMESPREVVRRASRVSTELAGLPDSIWIGPPQRPVVEASRYLHNCTAASDRVLIVSYAPEVLAFADRRFAGGRATFNPLFYDEDVYTDFTIAMLQEAPAALVLVDASRVPWFPRLVDYIEQHYRAGGQMILEDGRVLEIFAQQGRAAGIYDESGWPCFTELT